MSTVRIDVDMVGPLKKAAEKAGVSVTKLVNEACRAHIGIRPAPARASKGGVTGGPDVHGRGCLHAKVRVHGWGTLCEDCGARVR